MQPKEMIIEVRLKLQSLASNVSRKLQDEEIIWRLNTAQNLIINDIVSPVVGEDSKFSDDIVLNSNIANLVEYARPIPAFLSTKDDRLAVCYVPSNCLHVLSAEGIIQKACAQSIVTHKTALKYIAKVQLPSVESFTGLKINVNGSLISDLTDAGTITSKGLFEAVNAVIEDLEAAGYSAYYNVSPFESAKNTLYVVSDSVISDISCKYIVTDEQSIIGTVSTRNFIIEELENTSTRRIPIIIKDPAYRAKLFGNTFHTQSKEFGLMMYSKLTSELFKSKSAIYNAVELTYIRKPRRINLLLNHESELQNHQQVCDKAAELIAADIMSPAYPVIAQDNIRNH